MVGAQIAMQIHAPLMILMTENIVLPGEHEPLAAITSNNTFTYNNRFSTGEIEAMHSEYINHIEAQRLEKLRRLHVLLGEGGEINQDLLKNRVVILVSDGLQNGMSLDLAYDYLKPVKTKKLIIVTPFASVTAVDKMHLMGDGLICLNVPADFFDTNHYYEDNTIPEPDGIIKIIETLPLHWANQTTR